MSKKKKVLFILAVTLCMLVVCSVPAFAVSESEVQAAVDEYGKDAVTGNIFVWFLCAIAFLKVSQKIDSFLAGLGVNVGHTGGSMLAEALIATRGVFAAKQFAGGSKGGSGGGSSSGGGGFMSGGLVGVVGRNFTNSGVKKATGQSEGGLGGKAYTSSVNKGGGFANTVIGKVATGNINTVGSISGEGSEAALMSYLGYTAMGSGATDVPKFSNVEIGGGRMMATETSAEHPDGIDVGMYHTDKYMKPTGDFTTITAADGTSWYKQYAQDTVKRTPYTAPNGQVAYREEVVKELPHPPQRKDIDLPLIRPHRVFRSRQAVRPSAADLTPIRQSLLPRAIVILQTEYTTCLRVHPLTLGPLEASRFLQPAPITVGGISTARIPIRAQVPIRYISIPYAVIEDCVVDGEDHSTKRLFADPLHAQIVMRQLIHRERESGCISEWQTKHFFVEEQYSEQYYTAYYKNEYCFNHYTIYVEEVELSLSVPFAEQMLPVSLGLKYRADVAEQILPWELTEEVRRTSINDPDLYAMIANALAKNERYQEEYAEEIANVAHKLTSEHTKIERMLNLAKKQGKI